MVWPSRLVPTWLKKKRAEKPDFSEHWGEIVAALSQQQYDPDAQRGYELFSGCFIWSDELPSHKETPGDLHHTLFLFMRYFNAYRASLILGKSDDKYASYWRDIQRDCPSWPALLPERCSNNLKDDLEEETERQVASVEHLLEVRDRAERIGEVRKRRESVGD